MVLDAMGKDYIIVETVGVGQDEIDVARAAHTTVIIMAPGFGDAIQSMKAGILEVGDIFVVNKADRPDAEKAVQDLLGMIDLRCVAGREQEEWHHPIVKTVAVRGEGLDEFWNAIQNHRRFLAGERSDHFNNLMRLKYKLILTDLVKQRIVDSLLKKLEDSGDIERYVDDLLNRRTDPYTLSERILEKLQE
jgi:LAO/AO transport system kinase